MPVAITESTSIDYDITGEGPPLLLVGGLGFGRWGWFKQVPAFSRHFRTITFDVRGERRLDNGVGDLAGEVVSLLNHLGVKKAHILGTSLGGFVAQELALIRPDLVDRLVLVCTSYGGPGPESISPRALSDMLGWGSFSPEEGVRRGLETATSGVYRAEHQDEFEQLVDWRLADSLSDAAYYEQARAGAGFDLSRDVGHITSPTLVIHGAEDRYVPVANAAALAGTIPGARLRVLDHAGHLVFIERFADVNREVVTFLKPHGSVGRQRGAGDQPDGVWRWMSNLSQALRRRMENMKAGVYKSISAGGRTSRGGTHVMPALLGASEEWVV
jgi:3-oxoadipate enol-lactonase